MTRAPESIREVRDLLLTHLDVDQDRVRAADLEPAEVGIVGNAAHRGGYHCGSDRVLQEDYSVVESSRDRAGLTLDAAALDVGEFSVTTRSGTHNLRTFSAWCVGQCMAGAADTRDIREIIYSTDGETVKRWDRLKRRSTGDHTHTWHTHFSFHRDAIKAGRDLTPLFRRYLTAIGLIQTEDIVATLDDLKKAMREVLTEPRPIGSPAIRRAHPELVNGISARTLLEYTWAGVGILQGRPVPEDMDEAEVARLILAGLPAEAIGQAIPQTLAKDVADILAARLAA